MSFASWKSGKLTRKCSPSDTSLYLNADLGVTTWRLYAKNDTQVEFLNFTGKTAISASEWQYTWLTRQLSTTAIPATSLGGGYTWLANQDFIHDQMHDQMLDPSLFIQVTRYANAAARDVAIPVPVNGQEVYLIAEGYFTDYVAGAWVQRASGAVGNASDTVAGKVEVATLAETTAGTNTGWTWAPLMPTPGDILALYAGINHTHAIYALVKNWTYTISSVTAWPSAVQDNSSASTGLIASPTVARLTTNHGGVFSTWYLMMSADNVTFNPVYTFTTNVDFVFTLLENKYYKTRSVTTGIGVWVSVTTQLMYTV